MIVSAAAGPSAYWYLTRGAGIVSLILLTASVVLGLLGSLRFSAAPRWPRFTVELLHRDVSLLAVVVLVVHVVTSVLDSFAPVKLTDAVIPFVSAYRPLWLGLGALAFDLMLALVITSLIRRRMGYKAWRSVHWLAYVCWPVAVLHGLGTGTDTKVWWSLLLTAACVAAVLAALWTRLARMGSEHAQVRGWSVAASLLFLAATAAFTFLGPLQRGWARRAGTPSTLLASASVTPASPVRGQPVSRRLLAGFSARVTGSVTQTLEPQGALIDLALRVGGTVHGRLRVRLAGAPAGGGLSLTGSQVDLTAPGLPSVLQGTVTELQGQQFVARVSGADGSSLDLHANLNIDTQTRSVTGSMTAAPAGGGR